MGKVNFGTNFSVHEYSKTDTSTVENWLHDNVGAIFHKTVESISELHRKKHAEAHKITIVIYQWNYQWESSRIQYIVCRKRLQSTCSIQRCLSIYSIFKKGSEHISKLQGFFNIIVWRVDFLFSIFHAICGETEAFKYFGNFFLSRSNQIEFKSNRFL